MPQKVLKKEKIYYPGGLPKGKIKPLTFGEISKPVLRSLSKLNARESDTW